MPRKTRDRWPKDQVVVVFVHLILTFLLFGMVIFVSIVRAQMSN